MARVTALIQRYIRCLALFKANASSQVIGSKHRHLSEVVLVVKKTTEREVVIAFAGIIVSKKAQNFSILNSVASIESETGRSL